MSRLQLEHRCQEVLGWLSAQVTIANAAGFSDISVVSESLMQNLFNLIEGGAAYINTNIDGPNADSIDLADRGQKIAVQVTSTTSANKITKTLKGFQKNKRKKEYSTLRFLFLADEYRPVKKNYSVSGAKLEFEDLGQLHTRIVRITDVDRLQRIVELLERELAPWVPYGKTRIELVKEKVTTTGESFRAECRINNVGEFSATDVQLSVQASLQGQVNVIPIAGWDPIPGSGEPNVRTFRALHSIHTKDSVRVIFELAGHTDGNVKFRGRLSATNMRSQFFEVTTV